MALVPALCFKWILMTTADFLLPPFSLSGNPLQKSVLYLFFICMLCEFYWPQPKKVLMVLVLWLFMKVWNSGWRLKKWLPVTTSSNYSFPKSSFPTPAPLNLGLCFLSFFLKNAWVHVWVTCHRVRVKVRRQQWKSGLFLPFGPQWQTWGARPHWSYFLFEEDLTYPTLIWSSLCSCW